MYTLAYFKSHPLRIATPFTDLSVGDLLAAEEHQVHEALIAPAAGAYIHYGGVELADLLTIHSPSLSQDTLDTLCSYWNISCGQVVRQLLFYVWLIITKEMRHGSPSKCETAFAHWGDPTDPLYGPAMDLCAKVSGGSSWKDYLKDNPGVNAATYVDCVERQYRSGGWSGAFGGKKWADIALEFKRFIKGDASAMVASDRCWTLVHNTGPIFNKGFFFKHHGSSLAKVLDAQASTSVFSLGSPGEFLDNSDYTHPMNSAFCIFADAAREAIRTVIPDYEYGATGAVNSDGSKVGSEPKENDHTETEGSACIKQVGTLKILSTLRGNANV